MSKIKEWEREQRHAGGRSYLAPLMPGVENISVISTSIKATILPANLLMCFLSSCRRYPDEIATWKVQQV